MLIKALRSSVDPLPKNGTTDQANHVKLCSEHLDPMSLHSPLTAWNSKELTKSGTDIVCEWWLVGTSANHFISNAIPPGNL